MKVAANALFPSANRYWRGPVDTGPVEPAPDLHPDLQPGFLPADYRGPMVVANMGDLYDKYYGPLVGTQPVLQQVSTLGVPIVYCGSKRDDKALSVFPPGVFSTDKHPLVSLRQAYPQARLFLLGNSKGDDAADAAAVGAKAYLRNTDPTQRKIPAGFHPVISDDCTGDVQARIVHDVQQSLGMTAAAAPAVENPVPRAPVHIGDKLAVIHRIGIAPLGSIPGSIAHAIANKIHRPSPAELMDAVRAQRDDAGARDRFLSRLTHPFAFADSLKAADRAEFAARLDRTKAIPGDWDGFQRYMDSLTQTREVDGSIMEPVIDGEQLMQEKLAAIGQARRFVNFANFKLLSDSAGWKLAHAFMDAADRGCKVRVFYDAIGSDTTDGLPTDPRMWQELRAHGVELLSNERVHPVGDYVSHMKVMSMDNGRDDGGQVAFTGGHNISDSYTHRWHEVDARIQGPAAAQVSRIFIDHYRDNGGVIPSQAEARMTTPGPALANGGKVRNIVHQGLKDSDFKFAYLRAIDTAEKNIKIANPYVSDPDIMEHLIAAAKRGVHVLIMLPHHNEKPPIQDIERAHYQDMLAAGIEIKEYYGLPMAHEKVATFDDRITTIGSSNLDERSFRNNDEANAWSSDPRVAADLNRRLFDADLPVSIPITSYDPSLLQNLKNQAFKKLDWFL